MKAMLTQKKADLATLVAPFAFDPELKQIARLLFSGQVPALAITVEFPPGPLPGSLPGSAAGCQHPAEAQ